MPPALNYRLQGHNYAAIGKHLGVTANAVQKDVVKALRDFIKPETAHAVLAMELTRLDAMQAAVYAEAKAAGFQSQLRRRHRHAQCGGSRHSCRVHPAFAGSRQRGAAAEAHKIINGKLLEGDPQGITYSPSLVVKS